LFRIKDAKHRCALICEYENGRLLVRNRLWIAAATALFPIAAIAGEPGDPRAGHVFASLHCSECHAVTPGPDKSPNADAPPFAKVAVTPGMTGRALAVWLQTSHPTMPDFLIAQEDRDNVIAYIMSLQPPQEH
jgi:mono/diheme cytochrome c family protein